VDSAKTNNSWLVFCTHIANTNTTQLDYLSQTIDYIKSLGIDIMTVSQALEYFENIYESRNETTGEYTVIGKNGGIYSSKIFVDKYIIKNNSGIKNTTPVTSFDRDRTTIAPILSGDNAGFPTTAGVLQTYRCHQDYGDDLSYQLWKPYNAGNVKLRQCIGGVWGSWVDVGAGNNISIDSVNVRTGNDAISTFPGGKITYSVIGSSGAATFPDGAGMLITNRLWTADNGYQYQEYLKYNSNVRYIRYADSSGAWSSWENLTRRIVTTVNIASRTINANSVVQISLSVPNAGAGDNVMCQPKDDLEAGIVWSCFVPWAGTVYLRIANPTTSAVTLVARDWRVCRVS
jgi:hypothetical protein